MQEKELNLLNQSNSLQNETLLIFQLNNELANKDMTLNEQLDKLLALQKKLDAKQQYLQDLNKKLKKQVKEEKEREKLLDKNFNRNKEQIKELKNLSAKLQKMMNNQIIKAKAEKAIEAAKAHEESQIRWQYFQNQKEVNRNEALSALIDQLNSGHQDAKQLSMIQNKLKKQIEIGQRLQKKQEEEVQNAKIPMFGPN